MPSSATEATASTGATASTATATATAASTASTASTGATGAARAAGPPDVLGRTAGGDEGSAVVEFVALGTLLLVPVVYFVLAVAQVQAGAFGVVAAAQQASQVLARAEPGALSDTGLTKLRRRHVGFIFQFFNLLPMLTAEENILLPRTIAGERPDLVELELLDQPAAEVAGATATGSTPAITWRTSSPSTAWPRW